MHEATIRLHHDRLASLGLSGVVTAARDAGVEGFTEFVSRGSGSVLHFRLQESLPEMLLDDAESIAWWGRLATGSGRVDYLCAVEPPEGSGVEVPAPESGTDDTGIAFSVVGSREAIGRSIATGEPHRTSPLLERLTAFPASGSSPIDGLTERQREVLRTAYDLGYYEVPRQASSGEIAEAVDLDPSTVSEHLQRAERNILGELLPTPE